MATGQWDTVGDNHKGSHSSKRRHTRKNSNHNNDNNNGYNDNGPTGQYQPANNYNDNNNGYAPTLQQPRHVDNSTRNYVADEGIMAQAEKLRQTASQHYSKRGQYFDQSKQAWNSGDKGEAKRLSDQGHAEDKIADDLNAQAAQLEYQAHNQNRPLGEIDLHMLYVNEALQQVDQRIGECSRLNVNELIVIVGRGIHSTNHIAKIAPAVKEMLQQRNIPFQTDQPHVGCLLVQIPQSYAPTSQDHAQRQQIVQQTHQQLAPTQQYPYQQQQQQYQQPQQQYQQAPTGQYPGQQQQYNNQQRQQQQEDNPIATCFNLIEKLSKCSIM